MALGKVESIDAANPTIGKITEDETGLTYPYNDPNFPNTGLKQGNPCTYDIDYSVPSPIATNLLPYVPTTRDITTAVPGPLTVAVGETLNVKKGGMVNGAINVTNGNLMIEDGGAVIGDIAIDNQGSFTVRKGGMVTGAINVTNGSACKIINKGNVTGAINVASANRLIIGNANGGGIITGSITVDKIRKLTITATSTINCGV
jgi:hypothetical protein